MPSLDWKTGFLKDIPISGNDLKHFISTIQGYPAGMQVSGTYRLAKEPLVSGGGYQDTSLLVYLDVLLLVLV